MISVGFLFACKKTEESKNQYSDNIIGQWKLIEVRHTINGTQSDTTDYSKENIIFDFQENNKLIVTGNIPDVLVVFDDFQEGEHFYEYSNPEVCPLCLPIANLAIDEPELGSEERRYFCSVPLDKKTMEININGWSRIFINLY